MCIRDSYSSNVSSTFLTVFNNNANQDIEITNIKTTIPSYLQSSIFNNTINSYLTSSDATATYATISNLNLKANIANPIFTGTITAPTINATTTLQVSGIGIDTIYMTKPWVQCIVNANGAILSNSSVGRTTPTISRTSGQAAGAWDITFTTHPNSFNYTHYVQVRTDSGLAFGVVSNVSSGSLKVRLYNSSQVLTDYQFSLVIFS